jgi:hypothetical protein
VQYLKPQQTFKQKPKYIIMKTKFTKLLITLSITLGSCSTDVEQTSIDLLTFSHWTAEQRPLLNGEMSKFVENHIFHKDGTYTQEFEDRTGKFVMKTKGTWNWTENNEIYLQINSINIKDADHSLEKPLGYYLQILEVSENTLKTIERFEGDAWDSGFAKERTYNRS